jgi:AraC family transcriptional regulator, regulatory protein of adaptative response / DNA-3-methyladenine glycosylase II
MCDGVCMLPDTERLWAAVAAGDERFDGWVFCAVQTTGIYCRPSCPARTPKRENVRFFTTAAAAQAAGFRACKRCAPDATPGSPEWDRRADLVGRAMRLIADGLVDREGVSGLARSLGYTERHIHRQLVAVVGVGPLALARAQRAQTARILLETTTLPVIDVAFASGFQSVRQFNATLREVFALTPSGLRTRSRTNESEQVHGAISLRLPFRAPLDGDALVAFLGRRAVANVEEAIDSAYRRSLRLPHGAGVVELRPMTGHVLARLWLDDLRDLGAAVRRSRALLDLDSDPSEVDETLGGDPLIGGLVRAAPGLRVPGHVDGDELAVRAVLGQQVSLTGAATLASRLVLAHGTQLKRPVGAVTHVFPTAGELVDVDQDDWAMPGSRRRALKALVGALADGQITLDAGAEREETKRDLLALPGIGPWTVQYIAMRALRDPDAFMASDLGVRHALEQLGHEGSPAAAERLALRWRPYRSYALQHLWAHLSQPDLSQRLAA